MDNSNKIWALNAQLIAKDNQQENVVVLILCEDEALCKEHIQRYIQINQVRLLIQFRPLPLYKYQRHYITPNGLLDAVKKLSPTDSVVLLFPDDAPASYADKTSYLTKTVSNPFDDCLVASNIPLSTAVKELIAEKLWGDLPYCYAIIHAVKSFWLPDDFKDDDIEYACLYEGDASEDYELSAPYIIKLPLDSAFTEKLFSPNPDNAEDGFNYWGRNIGILFKSQGSFLEIVKHFRQFMYMRTYDERLLYFRFFDPLVLCQYLDIIHEYPNKLATFFGGGLIELFVANVGDTLIDYVPTIDFLEVEKATKQFEKLEMQIFIDQHDEELLQTVVNDLKKDFTELSNYSHKDIYAVVKENFKRVKKYNMDETEFIYLFTSCQLLLGGPIDTLDNTGVITDILKSDEPEHVKINTIKKRILQLTKNIPNNATHHGDRK